MLREELMKKLVESIKKNPKDAVKIIEKEPEILKMLLNDKEKVEQEKNEKIRYVNMNIQMKKQLQDTAKRLNITQGLLMGAGVLWFLSMLEK